MLPGIGIFGTGAIVDYMVPILKQCGFQVEAIWGGTREIAARTANDLSIPFSTKKVDEVLLCKDVDLVVIICPPHLQSHIALKALGIGKHVVCGTPTGPTALEILRMVTAAQYYPSLLSIMCSYIRHAPNITKMKELIDDGFIGEVHLFEVRVQCGPVDKECYDWVCDSRMGGGMLNTYGSMTIDAVTYITNQRAKKVNGVLRTFTKTTEHINGIREITSDDFCNFQMELSGGAFVSVTLNNNVAHHFSHEILACGSEGRLVTRGADLFEQKVYMTKETQVDLDPIRIPVPVDGVGGVPASYYPGLVRLVESLKSAFELVDERHSFSKKPIAMAATFEDALYVQSVVDAIVLSSSEGQWKKVNILTEEPEPNPFMSSSLRRSTFSL